jgi:3,4-dihydroxy 2-butanone 4-phosphate synthase/GTP cyclohydrolase II
VALVKGTWKNEDAVLVRVHSSCMTGDIFGSYRCDCGSQLHEAMRMIEKEGRGVIIYMNQEGRGIGIFNKIKAYQLQDQGRDTVEANLDLGFEEDERDYGVGASIMHELGLGKVRLITNNPIKRAGLEGYGISVVENVPLVIPPNEHNLVYLKTKKNKMGHLMDLLEDNDFKIDVS